MLQEKRIAMKSREIIFHEKMKKTETSLVEIQIEKVVDLMFLKPR